MYHPIHSPFFPASLFLTTTHISDYGIVLGYRLYVRELRKSGLAAEEGSLSAGDTILKVCSTSLASLLLRQVSLSFRHLSDSCVFVA